MDILKLNKKNINRIDSGELVYGCGRPIGCFASVWNGKTEGATPFDVAVCHERETLNKYTTIFDIVGCDNLCLIGKDYEINLFLKGSGIVECEIIEWGKLVEKAKIPSGIAIYKNHNLWALHLKNGLGRDYMSQENRNKVTDYFEKKSSAYYSGLYINKLHDNGIEIKYEPGLYNFFLKKEFLDVSAYSTGVKNNWDTDVFQIKKQIQIIPEGILEIPSYEDIVIKQTDFIPVEFNQKSSL